MVKETKYYDILEVSIYLKVYSAMLWFTFYENWYKVENLLKNVKYFQIYLKTPHNCPHYNQDICWNKHLTILFKGEAGSQRGRAEESLQEACDEVSWTKQTKRDEQWWEETLQNVKH